MRNIKMLWGAIAVLLIAVLLLAFALTALMIQRFGNGSPNRPAPPADSELPVATVGGKSITKSSLEEQLKKKYGRDLLNQMIDHEVIHLEATEQGITVSEAEMQRELMRMQQGYDSEAQFYQAMRDQLGLTPDMLKNDLTDKVLMEKLATKDIRIDDDAVEAYLAAHPDEFRSHVQLRLQQMVLSGKDQAAKALADLAKGTDFAEVVKQRSLDDATRGSGGDLGWIDEDDPFVPAPVLKAAKQLKPGEVSKPIESDGKTMIIRLKERKEPPKLAEQQIREQVRKQLALQEAPPLQQVTGKLREKWKVTMAETF